MVFFIFLFVLFVILCVQSQSQSHANKESFYNIYPTSAIDPEYVNINENPLNYFNYMTVGDVFGVDMNCNNVSALEILQWLAKYKPAYLDDVLHAYVYKYDPSINIFNPTSAPRVLKMLFRNLPNLPKSIPILRKCLPRPIRIT